jgi:hypothetical protein
MHAALLQQEEWTLSCHLQTVLFRQGIEQMPPAQGVAFGGPALCMLACSLLTPAGAAHVAGATPHTGLIVALFSAAFAMGAWARAGLYCNHQARMHARPPARLFPVLHGRMLSSPYVARCLP